jgi:hypothetical protein
MSIDVGIGAPGGGENRQLIADHATAHATASQAGRETERFQYVAQGGLLAQDVKCS